MESPLCVCARGAGHVQGGESVYRRTCTARSSLDPWRTPWRDVHVDGGRCLSPQLRWRQVRQVFESVGIGDHRVEITEVQSLSSGAWTLRACEPASLLARTPYLWHR